MRGAYVYALAFAEYAIYADCGSTGTRVYLIHAEAGAAPSVEKVGKGPAVTGSIAKATSGFASLVDQALAKIPEPESVGLYALGTAGMRNLPEERQHDIWREIEGAVEADAVRAGRINARQFHTITGNDEGFFGLLSVNYLARLSGRSAAPVGSLDLGGSSTQVALPAHAAGEERFVRSYPWGMELARQRLASPACFASDSDPEAAGAVASDAADEAPLVRGNGPACRRAIRANLERELAGCEGDCLGEAVQWRDVGLYALSGLFYAADFANWALHSLNSSTIPGFPSPRFADLETAADFVCSQRESDLSAARPAHSYTGSSKLPHRCFEINYQVELFKVYGIPDDRRITYVDTIDGHDVEWTLGAHLHRRAWNGSNEL